MEAICSECKKIYEERKEEIFCLIGEVDMICYECAKKSNNIENDIMYLYCGTCEKYFHIFYDKDHIERCVKE